MKTTIFKSKYLHKNTERPLHILNVKFYIGLIQFPNIFNSKIFCYVPKISIKKYVRSKMMWDTVYTV